MNGQHAIFVISLVTTLSVGYFDYLRGGDVSMMLLYAVPILLAARYCGTSEGVIVAAGAALCWFVVNISAQQKGVSDAVISWNALSRLGIFALLAYAVSLQVALKKALERERLRARTDQLTGLLNKWAFREQVEDELERASRYRHPLSIAFIDLNNFKDVNDLYGHARGDKLLQAVSDAIREAIRKTDLAGRVGGDEFTICFPETGPEQIRTAIGKLLQCFDITTSQSGWQVTASVGVVTYGEVCDSYDAMLAKADNLMYEAKAKGGNKAEFLVVESGTADTSERLSKG